MINIRSLWNRKVIPPVKKGKRKKGKFNLVDAPLMVLKKHFFLPGYLKAIKKMEMGGFSGGNKIKVITDGDDCFDEFIRAIKSANFCINLETFIFRSDDLGWRIAKLLVKKASEGVQVNVIYDSFGSRGISPRLILFMKRGGVEVLEFHPLLPWRWRRLINITLRDHRKILVVDGKVAFIGGINIGLDYAGKKYKGNGWRDTHLKIEGPAVKEIQFFFVENWFRNRGSMLEPSYYFPTIKEQGKKLLMILSSKSRRNVKPIRQSYMTAIKFAKKSIYIENAYFIPDARFYHELGHAAKRGVDVRLLMPGKSDVPVVKFASRYLYKYYLRHGIRVYEYKKTMLHAKTAVIDGIWSTIGSSNLDRASFRQNMEINAIILDQQFGDEMEEIFLNDLKEAKEYKLENWIRRSAINYIIEWICYRFRNIL